MRFPDAVHGEVAQVVYAFRGSEASTLACVCHGKLSNPNLTSCSSCSTTNLSCLVGWCTNWCSGSQARSLTLIARAPHSQSLARLPGGQLHLRRRRVVVGCRRHGRCPTGCLSPGGSGLVCLPSGWDASA